MWDSSAASATESATIATVTDTGGDLVWQFPFSGSVRHSDGHLIVSVCTEIDTGTADHRVFDLNGTGSISELTAITTDKDDHFYPSMFIDQSTNDIYVAYHGKRDGSEALATTSKVYYVKSTDDGSTWSAGDTAYQEGSADTGRQTWAPLSGLRFGVSWRASGTLNFNKVNSIAFSANVSVTPTTVALTTATFAPTVTASDHKTVTPSTKALTLATFAPSVTLGFVVAPTTASLTTTGFAPTVTATAHQSVTPTTAGLTLATFAPTVSTPRLVTPVTASLTLTTFAPTVTGSDVVAAPAAESSGRGRSGRRYRIIEDPDRIEEEIRVEEKKVEVEKKKLRVLIKRSESPNVEGVLYQQIQEKIEKLEAKIDDRLERIAGLMLAIQVGLDEEDDEEEEIFLLS
jgi:hypothetical protein